MIEPMLSRRDAHGPSKQRKYTHTVMVVISVIVVAVLSAALQRHIKLDPFACIASAYICGMLLLQHWMMEWPQCDPRPYGMGLLALGMFIAPEALHMHGMWQGVWPLLSKIADALTLLAAYAVFVRGPAFEPSTGIMDGQVVIITGCNTGIGLETAKAMARVGATVIFACRTESKARDAMQAVLAETSKYGVTGDQLIFLQLDLSSFDSVRKFVKEFSQLGKDLHVLTLNAGAFFPKKEITQDNLDMCLQSNHFGHFLLTQLLLPTILATEKKGGKPRIVQVNSALAMEHKRFDFSQAVMVKSDTEKHEFLMQPGYETFRAYGQAKVGNMLCMRELSRRLKNCGSKVPVNAVHPGEIDTDITRNLHPVLQCLIKVFKPCVRLVLKSPYQGSLGTVFACTAPDMATSDDMHGQFLMRMRPVAGNDAWLNDEDCSSFWGQSLELTGAPDVPPM